MSYELDTAERYRRHAQELRNIAGFDRLEETRRMLLKVASDYDKMAEDMEAIAEMHRFARKRFEPH